MLGMIRAYSNCSAADANAAKPGKEISSYVSWPLRTFIVEILGIFVEADDDRRPRSSEGSLRESSFDRGEGKGCGAVDVKISELTWLLLR